MKQDRIDRIEYVIYLIRQHTAFCLQHVVFSQFESMQPVVYIFIRQHTAKAVAKSTACMKQVVYLTIHSIYSMLYSMKHVVYLIRRHESNCLPKQTSCGMLTNQIDSILHVIQHYSAQTEVCLALRKTHSTYCP